MAPVSVMRIQSKGEMPEKIRVALNENINTKDQDLADIKDWLRKQPHLPNEWDDNCLMSFLRVCNFSLEKSKRKIDMYFTMRAACPEYFTNTDITRPELRNLISRVQCLTLPGLTPSGTRVTIYRGLDKNLDTHQLNDGFKLTMMVSDINRKEEVEEVTGDVFILDASIVKASHLSKISPSVAKKFCICIQEACPVKLKSMHVVNTTSLIDTLFAIVKPFLKDKMRQRLFFHSDYNALHEYIPKELLPTEYGGTGGSLTEINMAWVKKLEEYRGWFKEQESLKANESLRPGKPTNYNELFGIEGSFRQLAID